MTGSIKNLRKKYFKKEKKVKWGLEHVGIPILIVIIGLVGKHYYDEFKEPRLYTKELRFSCDKEGDRYKIETNFTIFNYGRSKAEKHKVMIQACGKIERIEIDPGYLGKMKKFIGGEKYEYVGYIISLEKNKEVRGKIVFYNVLGWPDKGLEPIEIFY